MSRITQYHVAKAAGVSNYVVSHALRGSPKVAERTRVHVMKVASDLGYRTNAFARATRSGRFGAIALLQSVFRHRSYLPHGLLMGINGALIDRDMHLNVAVLPDEKLTDAGYVPKMLREWAADGLLVNYIAKIPQTMVTLIEGHALPSIWLNCKRDSDCVYPDDLAAGTTATERLLCAGHRQIAFMNFASADHYSSHDRRHGYEAAMQRAGLPAVLLGGEGDRHVETSQRSAMIREALAGDDRPTAIVAYGEDSLLPVLRAAWEQGLSVPGDLSLVVFADSPHDKTGLRVDTLVIPEQELGRQAVQMLCAKIEQPHRQIPSRAVEVQFEPGESCSPPRRS